MVYQSIADLKEMRKILGLTKEAVADKITGTIVKEIYVPGKIINIVCK